MARHAFLALALCCGLAACGISLGGKSSKENALTEKDKSPVVAPAAAQGAPSGMSAERFSALKPGAMVDLDLGAHGMVPARTLGVDPLDGGRFVWRGAIVQEGAPDGEATLVFNGDKVTGSVRTPKGDTFQVKPAPQGGVLVERTDHSKMKPD